MGQGGIANLICSVYLSVAARTTAWADAVPKHTSKLLGRKATNNQQQLHKPAETFINSETSKPAEH